LPQRKNIRLENYDYSKNGYYFVSVCAFGKKRIFGKIIDEKMMLNDFGKIAEKELFESI